MDRRSVRVFGACVLGALVGTLIALELSPYLWWIGLIAGAATGYLTFEARKVVTATPRAWGDAIRWWKMGKRVIPRDVALTWCAYMMLTLNMVIFMAIVDRLPGADGVPLSATWTVRMIGWMALCNVLVSVWFERRTVLSHDFVVSVLRHWNPFSVWIYYPLKAVFYWLPMGMIWTVLQIPSALRASAWFLWNCLATIGRFLKFLFLEIHSDLRVLCAVDAAIGTAIGYAAGNALVGALAGGMFGILNYVVVSKIILGLAPRNGA